MMPYRPFSTRGRFPQTRTLPTSHLPPFAPQQQFVPQGEAPRAQFAAMGLPSRALNAPLAQTYVDIVKPPPPAAARQHLRLAPLGSLLGRSRRKHPPVKSFTDLSGMKLWGGWLR